MGIFFLLSAFSVCSFFSIASDVVIDTQGLVLPEDQSY